MKFEEYQISALKINRRLFSCANIPRMISGLLANHHSLRSMKQRLHWRPSEIFVSLWRMVEYSTFW